MKYNTAHINAAHVDGGKVERIDLEGMTTADLFDRLRELFPPETDEDHGDDAHAEPDECPARVRLFEPEGFAVHLFHAPTQSRNSDHVDPFPTFDEINEAWSDESDDDRREAMGEYLDDMGAQDLSDFDEAYQGQYSSGADFAEELAESVGALSSSDEARWICIDWEATWNCNLRHDYHITNSGHVFRNL